MRPRTTNRLRLTVVILAVLVTPWFGNEPVAVANDPPAISGEKAILSGIELYTLIAGQDFSFVLSQTEQAEHHKPGVHVVDVDRLVELYEFFTKHLPPDEVPLSHLTACFRGWVPVYLPAGPYKLEDQLLLSTGIIDRDLLQTVGEALVEAGYDPVARPAERGYVALVKNLIPRHYPTDRIVLAWRENRIALWPVMKLASELNIPAYRWRLFHVVDGRRYMIADWPVVVGKNSTRTRVAQLPMDQVEHYPPWTDPETREHVRPGPGNPLGLWKLRSTHTRRLWYYHGTNRPRLLKRTYRAFSHGCIRNDNDNIRRLGWLLLSHNAGLEMEPGLVAGRTDIFPQRKYRVVPLVEPVMAENRYDTIEVARKDPMVESVVTFYPNVYGIGAQGNLYRLTTQEHLMAELKAIGVPSGRIDPKSLHRTIQSVRSVRRPAHVEVNRLITNHLASL